MLAQTTDRNLKSPRKLESKPCKCNVFGKNMVDVVPGGRLHGVGLGLCWVLVEDCGDASWDGADFIIDS